MSTWRPSGRPRAEVEPHPLAESLDRVVRALGGPTSATTTGVFGGWEALVGADIAAHARPVTLRNGLLSVEVDHPAWAAELRFMVSDLLRRIAEGAGPAAAAEVTDIRFVVAGAQPRKKGSDLGRSTRRTDGEGP